MSPTLCAMDGAAEPPGMDLPRVGGMDSIGRLSLKILKSKEVTHRLPLINTLQLADIQRLPVREVFTHQRIQFQFKLAELRFGGFIRQRFHYHTSTDGDVTQAIDDDETAGVTHFVVRVHADLVGQ